MYFHKTGSVRDIDTVTFFTKVILFPKVNTDYFLRQAAEDIISILTTLPVSTTPSIEVGDTTSNALLKIATIMNQTDRLLVASPTNAQDYTQTTRVKTPKKPSLHPVTTPTSKTQAIPPRVVAPIPAPTLSHKPTPTYNKVTYKRKWGVQSLPQTCYNLRSRQKNNWRPNKS